MPWSEVAAYWPVVVNLLAGSLLGAWLGAGWVVRLRSDTLYRVIALNFGVMKLVFLAIVVYEAWVIPRPPKLALAT